MSTKFSISIHDNVFMEVQTIHMVAKKDHTKNGNVNKHYFKIALVF